MEKQIKQFLKTIKLNESLLSMIFGMATVVLVGILVFRIYNANKPTITQEADETTQPAEMVGEVAVETKEDGLKYPTELPESYQVQAGEHLWQISEKHYGSGYNWVDIAKENNLTNPGILFVDQELKLPKVAVREAKVTAQDTATPTSNEIVGDSYTVVKGDHLWGIAVRAYGDGYKWVELAKANEIANPNLIEVGQVIKIAR